MKKVEFTIERIAAKDQLHRLIDEMPDTAQAFLVVADYDQEPRFRKNCIYGHPSLERVCWMLEEFKHFLLTCPEDDDDDATASA